MTARNSRVFVERIGRCERSERSENTAPWSVQLRAALPEKQSRRIRIARMIGQFVIAEGTDAYAFVEAPLVTTSLPRSRRRLARGQLQTRGGRVRTGDRM